MLRLAAIVLIFCSVSVAEATEAGWALLRDGGHVVLLRHAQSPGSTEPANFDVENCATQRNLSDRGKQQARKIGALFAARAERTDKVLSSRYCRTRDTARLAFGDRIVEDFAPLDPVVASSPEAGEQIAAVMEQIRAFTGSGNLVLVTHLETIVALTGQQAREGEAVIVRPEGEKLHVLGRIVF